MITSLILSFKNNIQNKKVLKLKELIKNKISHKN